MTDFSLAPDFPASLDWVNTTPTPLVELRGRVVAVVFWHAASSMSKNTLADLGYLQTKYADSLTVIGIHTPKFDAQRDSELVARTVNRLGVRFAVASDSDVVAWQHYGIRSWPSVALINAHGQLVEVIAGDQQRDIIERKILRLLDEAGEQDIRVYENALAIMRPEPNLPVLFPSALVIAGSKLYVSDSGHHRILECSLDGRIHRIFGSGSAGFSDGGSSEATFQQPGGLAVLKDVLYVADTGNHAIRRIRLSTGDVDTLVGTGHSGTPHMVDNVRNSVVSLDRPCDLAANFDRLYISMSGANQIWELDLARFTFRPLAGSGRLSLADGVGALAAFAQPVGISVVQHTLYVADSAASALRSMHLGTGNVKTLIGHGLSDFGYAAGSRETARLQYPFGLSADPKAPLLWVADCYNNAIAVLRTDTGELSHFLIPHPLRRPTSVISDGSQLWIANTDAHEVIVVDLGSRQARVLPMMP